MDILLLDLDLASLNLISFAQTIMLNDLTIFFINFQ
jgi:hypothetical protein